MFDILVKGGTLPDGTQADIGITGGGNGKHMVYLSGVTDHTIQDASMVDHIVQLVEAKAAEIELSVRDLSDIAKALPALGGGRGPVHPHRVADAA